MALVFLNERSHVQTTADYSGAKNGPLPLIPQMIPDPYWYNKINLVTGIIGFQEYNECEFFAVVHYTPLGRANVMWFLKPQ